MLAREIPHKGGRTMGYRVSDEWSSLAYLSDHGPAMRSGPGPDGFGPYHEAAMDLCRGVDLVIHDAQYTASELPFRVHYGHSAADYAVALARRAARAGCCCSTTIPNAPTPRSPRSSGRCAWARTSPSMPLAKV